MNNLSEDKAHKPNWIQPIVMMLSVWIIIESEIICSIVPNYTVGIVLALIVWIVASVIIFHKLKKQNVEYAYYTNHSFTGRDYLILFFVVMSGVTMASNNYLNVGVRPLVIREYFSGNLLYTIRNIFYYPIEVFLMIMLIMCAQRGGELLTKKQLIPWGALALSFLWGLPHILYHGFTDGIQSVLLAFIYSIPYYASDRNIKTSYVSMLILWLM